MRTRSSKSKIHGFLFLCFFKPFFLMKQFFLLSLQVVLPATSRSPRARESRTPSQYLREKQLNTVCVYTFISPKATQGYNRASPNDYSTTSRVSVPTR